MVGFVRSGQLQASTNFVQIMRQFSTGKENLGAFCSAWQRLKLNTRMGFKHPPGTISKSFRLSKVVRLRM